EIREAHVAGDADDLERRQVAAKLLVELKALPERIMAWPEPSSGGFADDRDPGAAIHVLARERPSPHQRNAQGLEVALRGVAGERAAADGILRAVDDHRRRPGAHEG